MQRKKGKTPLDLTSTSWPHISLSTFKTIDLQTLYRIAGCSYNVINISILAIDRCKKRKYWDYTVQD